MTVAGNGKQKPMLYRIYKNSLPVFVILALLLGAAKPGVALQNTATLTTAPDTQPRPARLAHFEAENSPSPYPRPGRQEVRKAVFGGSFASDRLHLLTTLTLNPASEMPVVTALSPSASQLPEIQTTASRLTYGGPLPAYAPVPFIRAPKHDAIFVDQWVLRFAADGAHAQGCFSFDAAADGFQRRWGSVPSSHPNLTAIWPAQDGIDAVDAHSGLYPEGLASWFICGPFDVTQTDKLLIQYSLQLDIHDPVGDSLFVGASTNGRHFQGAAVTGITPGWTTHQIMVQRAAETSSLWLVWVFASDSDGPPGTGAWLDDIQFWQYDPPATLCGQFDAGEKGIVLTPYDPTEPVLAPMIRADDTIVIDRLKAMDVHWVRLGFQERKGSINLQDYDRMIDTLCAQGISVLGLLNQEMLLRQDYQTPDDETAAAYRAEFATMAGFLAGYFAGRVAYWEVWNEPNLAEGAHLTPPRYAHLLYDAYQAIRQAAPTAQVLFGGLASAWMDSHEYLTAVYDALDMGFGGAHPFEHLALHPYARNLEGPNPAIYMYADHLLGYTTIVDKFLQTMAARGDAQKTIWVTEVGWNSAQQSSNRPGCFGPVLVQEPEQASYLKIMFDILFNEVSLWEEPGSQGVEKVFWYQFMDVGALDPCWPTNPVDAGDASKDWWFGLYRGDRVTPKPGQCAFAAYPNACQLGSAQ